MKVKNTNWAIAIPSESTHCLPREAEGTIDAQKHQQGPEMSSFRYLTWRHRFFAPGGARSAMRFPASAAPADHRNLGRGRGIRGRSSPPLRASFIDSTFKAAGVSAIFPCSRTSPLARLGKCNRNGILVYVEADVGDRLLQDPSPMHEARHRPSGATLDNLHTVRRVAPISGEHLV